MHGIFNEVGGQKVTAFGKSLWEWQYLRDEFPSTIVVADHDGRIVGYFHMPVYAARYQGRPVLGAVTCDLATLPEYRRQGMMRALDDHARELLAKRGVEIVIGFPHPISYAGFTGHGAYSPVTKVPTYVRPLDLGRMLAGRLRPALLGRAAGALAGPLYHVLKGGSVPLRPAADAAPIERFDADMERVSAEFADQVRISYSRTARYLNWRFCDKPSREYEVWGMERAGRARAYVITRVADLLDTKSLVIVDLGCGRGEEQALLELIASRLAAARDQGAALCLTMGIHPFFARLGAVGFLPVPERMNPRLRYMIATGLSPAIGPDLLDQKNWLVTLADWDVM
jgi:predicted N-acetyltransferase YhbS